MNAIAAIETRYRHVVTRSRLEARWLVWLDSLQVPWEYEPEDFSLPDRGYRPDLWLPKQEAWCEIKPSGVPFDHQLAAAIQEQSGSPLLWIAGEPRAGCYSISLADFGGVEEVPGLVFAMNRKGELWLADPEQTCCLPLPPRWMEFDDDFPLMEARDLEAAYRRAMTWRF